MLKQTLESDFKTINKLLTDAVAKGITIDTSEQLQPSESPIRSDNDYKECNNSPYMYLYACTNYNYEGCTLKA